MEIQQLKQRFGIIGNSPKLNHALAIAERVASTDLSVLITGESGVGKEVFSKIIHQLSTRKHEPFIAVNTGAIPEGTIDSELFGHKKGAFTGASDNRKGYFETVNGGTIFLDEIGEMPIGTQARLLRVLESGEFIRVGDSEVQKTDVRIIAATNVDLLKKVREGKFREDLYFRLNTVPINVPPLRERREDIYLLFRKFATDFAERYRSVPVNLTEDAQLLLSGYRFPGNIRELKNIAEQVSVLTQHDTVTADELRIILPVQPTAMIVAPEQEGIDEREILYKMLFEMKHDLNNIKSYLWTSGHQAAFEGGQMSKPELIQQEDIQPMPSAPAIPAVSYPKREQYFMNPPSENQPVILSNSDTVYEVDSFEESLSIAEMEKELIQKALTKHKGRRKKAALDLGISERTLYRKIKEYDIDG
ncbi:MAG: sigma-54 dependent transcriptional regulator [Saprospiraceae bacterium]|nr:sigma-54 dependent transcriptional regulator [Saprospiraceae bacterium]